LAVYARYKVTFDDLQAFQGHLSISSLYKCDSWNICAGVDKVSTDTARRPGLCAIAEACACRFGTVCYKSSCFYVIWSFSWIAAPVVSAKCVQSHVQRIFWSFSTASSGYV